MKACKKVLLFICFFGVAGIAFSQPPGGPPDDEDPAIPLDGGISLLAGAGILYGIKSLYSKTKNK